MKRWLGRTATPQTQPAEVAGLTEGPVWLDRLIYGASDRGDDLAETSRMAEVLIPPGPWVVGLRDAMASGWFDVAASQIVPGVTVDSSDTVVDIGCGEGNLLSFCAGQGASIVGVDNHAETLKAAERRLADIGHTGVFHEYSGVGPLPLPDGTATVVLCTEVLEHVADPDHLMIELVRIAAPGARFVISVPAAESEELTRRQAPPGYFETPNHIQVFDEERFRALVERSGLEVQSITRLGFFWTVWFALHWHTGVSATVGRHPVLDLWTATWDTLLDSPGGESAKAALDASLPKSQLIVARRPNDMDARR